MDNAKSSLLDVLRGFEEQFKEAKQEYKDNLHLDGELKEKSIPAKYKGPKQKLLNDQANVSSRLAVVFKCQLKEVLLHFFNNSPDVNGYAIDVVEMLTCDLVGNPEDNLTNQLMDTEEVGHFPEELTNLEVKVEEMDQDSTEVVLSPVESSDDSHLQPSTTSHSNDEAMIPAINKLPQLVTPVVEQNTNNCPEVIEPPAHISKKDMWKKLPLEPPKCLVKGCSKLFDYRRIRQDHIENDHQNTRVWHCALCHKHYTTYTTLERHYQKKHVNSYQCKFASCAFTSKTKRQVTKHFEECHMVSAIVNHHKDNFTNQDTDEDDDLSEHVTNSKANANVQPIHQGSTGAVPSPVASGSDGPNQLSVVQQPSTSTEPKTMKRTSLQSYNNEECNQVYLDGQGQSSTFVKKAKLDLTQSNDAQSSISVDLSCHRSITEHCGLSFDNLDDQHLKLVHSYTQAINTVENALTNVQNSNIGKDPIMSQQSSNSTSIHFETPVGSSLESGDNEECIDVGDQGQSSKSANKPKLNTTHSDHAQSQVTNGSEQNSKAKYNPFKEELQHFMNGPIAICLGFKCFQLDCERMFDTKEELNHHMWERHCIRAFPCLVKDCDKSFSDSQSRVDHIKKDHNGRTSMIRRELRCAKCIGYHLLEGLSAHYTRNHSALYQCGFASCTFTDGNKTTTSNHYISEHMIACRQSGCAKKSYVHAVRSQYRNIPKHYHYI